MNVLYEDNHLIAVQKEPGDIVQGDQTGDEPLNEKLKGFLKEKYHKPGNVYVGTLHRLDRPVYGLVLFAKTGKAAERMSKAFAKHQVEKTYYALTDQEPANPNGTLVHHLKKDERTNTSKAFDKEVNGSKRAELNFQKVATHKSVHLLRVHPKTGRPHQIRVQLAAMGCPIWGDVKYGSAHKTTNRSLYLCCYSMKFVHPVKKEEIQLVANWPLFGQWAAFQSYVESPQT